MFRLTLVKVYIWQGMTRGGRLCGGKVLAQSKEMLKAQLYQEYILIKNIRTRWNFKIVKGIKAQEIFIFTRQMARLLSAGLVLTQVLALLASSTTNKTLQNFIQQLIAHIENGYSLSEALYRNPLQTTYFGELYCSLIALGEKTGSLALMLDRIACDQEKSLKLKSKLTGILLYPTVVLLITGTIFLVLLIGVVPQFEHLFLEVGAQLPLLTRVIICLGKHLVSRGIFWGLFFLVLGSVFFGLKKKYLVLTQWFDQCYTKLPIIKKFLAVIVATRFSRILSIALLSGLPLLDALRIIADIVGNFSYKTAILASCERIRNGESLYQTLARQRIFPVDLLQLIKIGEMSGCLSETLNNAADLYEEKINYFANYFTELLEPLLIIILGLMVGTLILAMYLPIFRLGSII